MMPRPTEPTADLLARAIPRPGPSVYVLWLDGAAVYVGQSAQPLNRITAHASKGVLFDSYTLIPAASLTEWERRDLEAAYIAALSPPLNFCQVPRERRRVMRRFDRRRFLAANGLA